MQEPTPQLVLASKSPRRRELLTQVGLRYAVAEIEIDETPRANELPRDYVLRMAEDKAAAGLAVSQYGVDVPVLGSDTAVVVDDKILGKPVDIEDATRQLQLLSGRAHQVLTAIALVNPAAESVCVTSKVWSETRDECARYCDRRAHGQGGQHGIQLPLVSGWTVASAVMIAVI